ncbi:MAG: hypothetical protein HQK55_11195, partial [Deltaproteobacteria bacterium]|nr:hypothetical protein [Deltaproteobacteria bacterium]
MTQPNVRELVVAGPLANVSIAYKNQSYIADQVFPLIGNCPPKAQIAKYLKSSWFRDEAGIRGPSGRANRGGYPIGYEPVALVEIAFAKEVTDEDRRAVKYAFAPPLQPDQDAIEFSTDKIDLRHERLVSQAILTGTWSGVTAGEDKAGAWAAGSGNTFIADIEAKIEYIRGQTGFRPNILELSANTLAQVKQESTVLDRIKYTERGVITPDLLASLFGLDQVLVGSAIYSTAKETKAGTEFTGVNVWEKNIGKGSAFLCYRPSAPGLKTPSAGYICRGAYETGSPRRVTTWREPAEHQDVYEVAEEIYVS